LNTLTSINVTTADQLNTQGDATFSSCGNLLFGRSLIGVVVIDCIGVIISRSIVNPLAIMAGALQNLQKGDLNRDIPQSVKDQIIIRKDELGLAG